ncbi:MAG TPA: glycosyl hydrolase family 8, partial [Chloroflexota bacterium]
MAALKGELFPTGTLLGGTSEHVSLIESLQYQMSRSRDGGVLDPESGFWRMVEQWAAMEPLLVVGGTVGALVSALSLPRQPTMGTIGVATFSLWAFLGRGGEIIGFYLIPLLPLLALDVGLVAALVTRRVDALLARFRGVGRLLGRCVPPVVGTLCLASSTLGYRDAHLGFAANPFALWTNVQAVAQKQAVGWIRRNVPPGSGIVIDNFMWTDLHDPPDGSRYRLAHWYWKVDRDPEIRNDVFLNDWRTVDYVVTTPQMLHDTRIAQLDLVGSVLEHSTPIARFDAGGWPLEVRRVGKFQQWEAYRDPVLARTWEGYKARFLRGGRVIDPRREGPVTTSEGQAYALLRAVYMNDRRTFDEVWTWTKAHLQIPESGLLAWLWGRRPDGSEGIVDRGAATDADQDAALALLFAARRWGEPHYQQEALRILRGIWEQETTAIAGWRVVVAGNWARGGADQPAILNPSYWAPYAYRIFAEADPDRPWMALVDSTYEMLARLRADRTLGGTAGLAPNWLAVDVRTGALLPADGVVGSYASEFSYDASRLPWRLALDWVWFRDDRAREALAGLHFPRQVIEREGRLAAAYGLDGTPLVEYEALSMYAGVLPSLLLNEDRSLVHRVFAEQILRRYVDGERTAHWGDPNNYYDQNWAWFATAFMDGALGNLWAGETTIDWERVFQPSTRG